MAKKVNLATALHKGSGKRRKDKPSTDATETSGTALVAVATEEGASAPKATRLNVIPALGRAVSKAVYGTFYYASYGIVFTAVTVAHWIPVNNPMGRGVRDGAAAAKADFGHWQTHADAESALADRTEHPAMA